MVHLHSCEARKRRREKAILKGYITAAKSCKQISPPGLEFAAAPRKSVEPDPWDIEDPWSLGRKAAKNCVICNACLPPCPSPVVQLPSPLGYEGAPPPQLPEPDASDAAKSCETTGSHLRAVAQEFIPKVIKAKETNSSEKLLESAIALIEMQNTSIAWLMQMLNNTSHSAPTSSDKEIETSKEMWKAEAKAEIESMMVELQKSMRETLDKKDAEIQTLREALKASQHCMTSGAIRPENIEITDDSEHASSQYDDVDYDHDDNRSKLMQTNDRWTFVENMGTITPKEWVPVLKKVLPVTRRCVECKQSLNPDLGAWQCLICQGFIHAEEGWTCKHDHSRRECK